MSLSSKRPFSCSSACVLRAAVLASGALLVGGCGAKTLDISVEQPGCEGISEGETPEPTLVQTTRGDDLVIYRDWVFQPSSATFEPQFEQGRKEVEIYEYWTDDGDADAVETCFRPTVVIKKPESGNFTLFWFVGDESTPFDNVLIEVD